jgi:DNA-binding CsgD family transcriptional regulator
MKKEFLEHCLAEGLSLEQIGKRVGRHPSTVSYHLRKHGLRAVHSDTYAPRGSGISRRRLEELLGECASLREIAAELGLSVSTVRYWLKRHSLTPSGVGRRRAVSRAARAAGLKRLERECPRHGLTVFVLESRGYYRCLMCRTEAVSRWRRRVKRRLAEVAGGACAICGYDRYQGALQFHHLDPEQKSFGISRGGVTRNAAEAEAEASKCVLLCANCHAEVEAGLASVPESGSLATVIDRSDAA